MRRSSRVGAIPSELSWLIDELTSLASRLDMLESPSPETLGSTLARVGGLVDRAVSPAVIYQLDTAPAFAGSVGDFAAVSTPVPDGYARALVSVTASATLRSNDAAGTWALLMVSGVITGASGFYNQWASVDGQKYGGASAASAAVLEGLTPGSTVDVAARVSFPGTYTLPRASVAGSILFLR